MANITRVQKALNELARARSNIQRAINHFVTVSALSDSGARTSNLAHNSANALRPILATIDKRLRKITEAFVSEADRDDFDPGEDYIEYPLYHPNWNGKDSS